MHYLNTLLSYCSQTAYNVLLSSGIASELTGNHSRFFFEVKQDILSGVQGGSFEVSVHMNTGFGRREGSSPVLLSVLSMWPMLNQEIPDQDSSPLQNASRWCRETGELPCGECPWEMLPRLQIQKHLSHCSCVKCSGLYLLYIVLDLGFTFNKNWSIPLNNF